MRWNVWSVPSMVVVAWAASNAMAQAPAPAPAQAQAGRAGAGQRPPARVAAAPPQQPAAPDPQKMNWLLDQWAMQSTRLKSLDVTITRVDKNPAWGNDEHFEGRAVFKSPGLAWIDFKKVVGDPKAPNPKLVPEERIICTGDEVWQYKPVLQQIFIFPLDRDAQNKALAEGPLPFLFNFRADEARKRYAMKLMGETKDSYIVAIKPLLPIDQGGFSSALVHLDAKYLLPTRITLISPNGKDSKVFVLSESKPNVPVSDQNFKGQVLPPPWKVVRNPDGQGPADAGNAPAASPRAGVPPRQPAASRPAGPASRR